MIRFDYEQGSDLWLQSRAGKITASRCKDARDRLADKPEKTDKKTGEVTPAQRGAPSAKQIGYASQVAVERIAGKPIDQGFENWQMREGRVQEPEARAAYEALTGNLVEEVGALATDDNRYLYSPDGLVGDDGLIEIKSLFSAERIINIVGNGDISDFTDQCNFGLWLTGRKWVDLVLWAPALATIGLEMTVIRIERNDDVIEEMESDLIGFTNIVDGFEKSLRSKAEAKAKEEAEAHAKAQDEAAARWASEAAIAKAKAEAVQEVQPAPEDPPAAVVQAAIEMADRFTYTEPTLRLGHIKDRLGFVLTEDFLKSLGFEPAATDKAAKLYYKQDFQKMCSALIRHIQAVAQGVAA